MLVGLVGEDEDHRSSLFGKREGRGQDLPILAPGQPDRLAAFVLDFREKLLARPCIVEIDFRAAERERHGGGLLYGELGPQHERLQAPDCTLPART